MTVLIFNEFGLKMPIRSQDGDFVCVGFHFINGEQSHRHPKKAPSWAESCHMRYRWLRLVHSFLHSSSFYPIPGNHMFCSGLDNAVKYPFPLCRLHAHLTQWFIGSTQLSSPNSISIGWLFCTAHGRVFLYFIKGWHFSSSKLSLLMSHLDPCNTWSLGRQQFKRNLDRFSRFCHVMTVTDWNTERIQTTLLVF